MSEPSERMQALVRTLRHAQHQAARTNTVTEDLVVADMELCSAIAELEQRAEKAKAERDVFEAHAAAQVREIREWIERVNKWKRVAVAREHAIKMQYNSSSEGLLAHREMLAAIADLGDEWTEATR